VTVALTENGGGGNTNSLSIRRCGGGKSYQTISENKVVPGAEGDGNDFDTPVMAPKAVQKEAKRTGITIHSVPSTPIQRGLE